MQAPFSIVIVRVGKGYVASIRFRDNKQHDCELSSVSKYLLHGYIERHLRRVGGYYL